MQKVSGIKGLEWFRSLLGCISSDAGDIYGSFTNLKIATEKLVKEQASVKTDLEMAHTKLRRETDQINLLEGEFQQAVNENAKLKVKQTEDSKLWQRLDLKVSSTKTLCDQLTETLQQLASQTEQAEKDKKSFEEKLGKNSTTLDEFNYLLHDLSAKLECAEQTIISGKEQMLQIKHKKEEMDQSYKECLCANDTTIKEKDSLIRQLEVSVDEYKACLINIDSRLQSIEQELKIKDDACISLKENLASAESVKNNLELRNQGCSPEIAKLCKDNKDLNDLLGRFVAKVPELDKEHASMSCHVSWLLSSFERLQGLVEEEKMLIAKSSKEKFEDLQNKYVELKSRIIELQKPQEIVMVQHVEECQVAEDNIRRLECETETASKINRLEKLASELQGRIQKLLEDSTLLQNHKQELLEKIPKLESENQELVGQAQSIMYEKSNNAEYLQSEMAKRDQQVDTHENEVNQIGAILDEKEQLYSCSIEREKTLEDQKLQVEASLAATECQIIETKKQYCLMLEGKQIELSRHLVELSLKNDQAINEIRKKYEQETIEITNAEKQKAQNLIKEIEKKCNEKISEIKKDFESYLMHLKEKHGAMVARIQQDNEHKESTLRDYHKEELQHIQSQAENELRERLSLLKKEHELQILRMQHGECQRLQEQLELQKSKEEKQRASLQLQWKVMGENQQVDQEVNSKKECSVSSFERTHPKHELELASPDAKQKNVNLSGIVQQAISNMVGNIDQAHMANGRFAMRRNTISPLMFRERSIWRSLHGIANKDILTKRKVPNFARIVLNRKNVPPSRRSFIRGIRRAQAWCRAHGIYIDLSDLLGKGVGVCTTPPGGTFHMIIEYNDRELTFFLHGKDLYVRGWTGSEYGTFEIQEKISSSKKKDKLSSKKKSEEKNRNYISDPACKVLKLGYSYGTLCKPGGVATVRIGMDAMMDYFEVVYKCNGTISGPLEEA